MSVLTRMSYTLIPFTIRAKERMRTLLHTLNEFDFSSMGIDFLGSIYEKLIPSDERKKLGQFYTPDIIANFIIHLTIKNKDDKILDPACGSGTFLVKAYQRLRALGRFPARSRSGGLDDMFHKELLQQIYGIDINQFPAHLSVINLAIQNPRARIDKVNVIVNDFFNIKPKHSTLFGFRSIDQSGKDTEIYMLPSFNVVVANPPYIRQELLGEEQKIKIEERIESEYKRLSIGKTSKGSSIVLDKRSDIYVYFLIHALSMLNNGGILGFITSNKWLELAYGRSFQKFLLDSAIIKYVIEFDRAIFSDAEINTSVLILEKTQDKSSRDNNLVKFVRFKKRKSLQEMINYTEKSNVSLENDEIKINVVKQNGLLPGKWSLYLRASDIFNTIINNEKVKPFKTLAKILFGIKTGYNEYFILDKSIVKDWKIEKEYIKSCVTSPKKIDGLTIEETEDYLLMVTQSKAELEGTNVLRYINYGEHMEVEVKRGMNTGKRLLPSLVSISNHNPYWYSLPQFKISPILFPRLIDFRPIFLKNNSEAHATHVFYYIYPNNKKNDEIDVILSYLNSSICAFLIELYGNPYGGGVLELLVYDMEELPVLDISLLNRDEKLRLGQTFRNLAQKKERIRELSEWIAEFISDKIHSRNFQCGSISPIFFCLNDAFPVVNNRIIHTYNQFSNTMGRDETMYQKLEKYPENIDKCKRLISFLNKPEINNFTVFDLFCYWYDHLRKEERDEDEEEISYEPIARLNIPTIEFSTFFDRLNLEELSNLEPRSLRTPDRIKINQIIENCDKGVWVLPNFQRYFEWKKKDVKEFLESIFNDYYVGSLLFWEKAKNPQLDLKNPQLDLIPIKGVNIELDDDGSGLIILDGQQRITALYYAIKAPNFSLESSRFPLYFYINFAKFLDQDINSDIIEVLPKKLEPDETYSRMLFPLYELSRYSEWVDGFEDYVSSLDSKNEQLRKIIRIIDRKLRYLLYGYEIPYISLPESMKLSQITDIFEKINTMGIRLSAFDLLIARLSNYKIDLKELWEESLKRHPKFGDYNKINEKMPIYILQSISLSYNKTSACSREDILNIYQNIFETSGTNFDEIWQEMTDNVGKAILKLENLRDGFGVKDAAELPFSPIIPIMACKQAKLL